MYFTITLTTAGGFLDSQIAQFVEYFNTKSHVYLTKEVGTGGNPHLQGIVEFDTSKTSNVTRTLKLLYTKLEIEVHFRSIRVKATTHLIGALIYSSKELDQNGKLLLVKGWKQSWIDEQVKNNVSEIPFKMLLKRGKRLGKAVAPALIYEWCIAHNMIVKDKFAMVEVVKLMAQEGFLFGSLRPSSVYIDVCALFGDGSAAQRFFENELNFL